jgi:hypothetical protein
MWSLYVAIRINILHRGMSTRCYATAAKEAIIQQPLLGNGIRKLIYFRSDKRLQHLGIRINILKHFTSWGVNTLLRNGRQRRNYATAVYRERKRRQEPTASGRSKHFQLVNIFGLGFCKLLL